MSKRRAIWILVGLLLLYPVSYVTLSPKGQYAPTAITPMIRGSLIRDRLKVQISLHWDPFPLSSKLHPAVRKTASAFYYPLIFSDRRFWHRIRIGGIEIC